MLTLCIAAAVFAALVALYTAGGLALDAIRARRAAKDRIARAVRPVHGRPVLREAPARAINRPGEN